MLCLLKLEVRDVRQCSLKYFLQWPSTQRSLLTEDFFVLGVRFYHSSYHLFNNIQWIWLEWVSFKLQIWKLSLSKAQHVLKSNMLYFKTLLTLAHTWRDKGMWVVTRRDNSWRSRWTQRYNHTSFLSNPMLKIKRGSTITPSGRRYSRPKGITR